MSRRFRRALARAHGDESGLAVLEFAVYFVGIVVPLLFVIVVVANLQRAMLGASSAAREAGRVYVTSPSAAKGAVRAPVVAHEVLANYRLDVARASLRIRCPAAPSGCFARGAMIESTVTYRVEVGTVPALGISLGSLPVTATNRTRVDQYRGFPR